MGDIVHIGVGGFHRAHQAYYTEEVLATGATEWGICGVGLLPFDRPMRDVMLKQDRLYTLWARGQRSEAQIIGSHCEYLFAPEEHRTVMDRLAASTTKVVTLTITEKGYCLDLGTGALDSSLQDVQADLRTIRARGTDLKTAIGFLVGAAE